MKKTLTFNASTISSTQSKINVEAWDVCVDAFDNKQYRKSFDTFMDYVNPEIRKKYGNADGTEYNIPHGSIVVNIKLENDQMVVNAPFVALPEKNHIPLLRQVASLNFNNLDLAQIILKDGRLNFEYSCPLDLANPWKIYYIFDEICSTGDKYDDEFESKFDAQRIYEPQVTPYDQKTVDEVYDVIQQSCNECFELVKGFEDERKFGFAWNIIATTLFKIDYYAHPQGQLMNDLHKAIREHDRDDMPTAEVNARTKSFLEKLQNTSKENLAADLYYVDTFIPPRRRSDLKNIQYNMEKTYENVQKAHSNGDDLYCCLSVVYKFYEMYYYNSLQDDVNNLVVDAMQRASAQPLEIAAPILYKAMDKIMKGDLEVVADLGDYMSQISTGFKRLASLFKK